MDLASINSLAGLTGISAYLLVIIVIWSLAWKLTALWKSARNGSIIWFIVLGIVNTVGILEILYIFVFSKINLEEKITQKSKKKSTKKVKVAKKGK